MNGWLCPTINTGLIFAASHSPGRSLGEARVSRPRPKWVGPYAARPLFFYALFAASLAKSPSSSLIASHNIRSTVFAPYFWDGAARSGVGSNSSDIVSQRLPWLSVEKNLPHQEFFQFVGGLTSAFMDAVLYSRDVCFTWKLQQTQPSRQSQYSQF